MEAANVIGKVHGLLESAHLKDKNGWWDLTLLSAGTGYLLLVH